HRHRAHRRGRPVAEPGLSAAVRPPGGGRGDARDPANLPGARGRLRPPPRGREQRGALGGGGLSLPDGGADAQLPRPRGGAAGPGTGIVALEAILAAQPCGLGGWRLQLGQVWQTGRTAILRWYRWTPAIGGLLLLAACQSEPQTRSVPPPAAAATTPQDVAPSTAMASAGAVAPPGAMAAPAAPGPE